MSTQQQFTMLRQPTLLTAEPQDAPYIRYRIKYQDDIREHAKHCAEHYVYSIPLDELKTEEWQTIQERAYRQITLDAINCSRSKWHEQLTDNWSWYESMFVFAYLDATRKLTAIRLNVIHNMQEAGTWDGQPLQAIAV